MAMRDVDDARSAKIVDLVRELSACDDPLYGYAHDCADLDLSEDPRITDPFAEVDVCEAYWILILSKAVVDKLGRKRVMSTPAYRVEALPQGGAMIVTMPSPLNVTSAETRRAQAAVLSHLKPEISVNHTMAMYAKRDRALAPVAPDWDADLAPVLQLIVDQYGGAQRQAEIERFNKYRPPGVAEVQKPPVAPNGPSLAYQDEIEKLIINLHDKEPKLGSNAEPEVLPLMDYHFYRHDYPGTFGAQKTGRLELPLGAWLGDMLVRHLGGRWVPRRNQDEMQVVIGDTAFLPMLRAKHYLESRQAVLDHSLTQYFFEAKRIASSAR
jgi:hypothetical protein